MIRDLATSEDRLQWLKTQQEPEDDNDHAELLVEKYVGVLPQKHQKIIRCLWLWQPQTAVNVARTRSGTPIEQAMIELDLPKKTIRRLEGEAFKIMREHYERNNLPIQTEK